MTLTYFNKLAEEKQAFIMEKVAVEVASTYNKHYEFILFQLNAFYVEAIYKNDGTLCGYRAFTAISQLDRYLNSIDITTLTV